MNTDYFDNIRVGERFRMVGEVTGKPSLYVFEKVDSHPNGYNAVVVNYKSPAYEGMYFESTKRVVRDENV